MAPTDLSRRELASLLLPLLDLTSLDEEDSPGRIESLCAAARSAYGFPAAVCVYPEHVTTVRRELADTPIKVATVVNFPDGGGDAARVARETRRALAAGADEIDMVLPHAALRAGDRATAAAAVRACRQACGGATMKLIIEAGELGTPELIREASELGLEAGVDFLKTSTGKVKVNATPEAAAIMLDAIARSGGTCGFKAAGGIRTLDDAQRYLQLAATTLGADWITPSHLRIGASALFGEILQALAEA